MGYTIMSEPRIILVIPTAKGNLKRATKAAKIIQKRVVKL